MNVGHPVFPLYLQYTIPQCFARSREPETRVTVRGKTACHAVTVGATAGHRKKQNPTTLFLYVLDDQWDPGGEQELVAINIY